MSAERPAAYDAEKHEWTPQCPHGDICTGCDARGYCTRVEGDEKRSYIEPNHGLLSVHTGTFKAGE